MKTFKTHLEEAKNEYGQPLATMKEVNVAKKEVASFLKELKKIDKLETRTIKSVHNLHDVLEWNLNISFGMDSAQDKLRDTLILWNRIYTEIKNIKKSDLESNENI